MFKLSSSLVAVAALVPLVFAQSPEWGQCRYQMLSVVEHAHHLLFLGGGTGWTGPTTCVAGTVCTEYSQYYSQCVPGVCYHPLIFISEDPLTL